MLTEERLSEIRALTWEWQYENCSDHQAAVDDLLRERDALAAEVERLRCFAELVAAGEPSPAEYNPSADGRDEALSSGNSGDIECYGIMTVYYQLAQKAKAVLLQPQGGE